MFVADRSGNTGVVQLIDNETDLQWVIQEGPAPPYVIVMPLSMLISNIQIIKGNTQKISG